MSNDYNRGYHEGYSLGFSEGENSKNRTKSKRVADDRARRIKELVREWVGRGYRGATPDMFVTAAKVIDAIDDAEIPAKETKP